MFLIRRTAGLRAPQRALPDHVPELGLMTDVAVAKLYGVSQPTVWRRRVAEGIPRFQRGPFLEAGKMSDADVAWLYGADPSSVSRYRKARGIPKFNHVQGVRYPEAGSMTDVEVAKIHGVGKTTIGQYRRRRGIPRFQKEPELPPMPPPELPPMPPPELSQAERAQMEADRLEQQRRAEIGRGLYRPAQPRQLTTKDKQRQERERDQQEEMEKRRQVRRDRLKAFWKRS